MARELLEARQALRFDLADGEREARMRTLTEPEALVYAVAFAHTRSINAARHAVQALREARAGAPASRDADQRMLADFRMQDES